MAEQKAQKNGPGEQGGQCPAEVRGTLTGNLIANGGTDYSTARVRNIHSGTADLTAGSGALEGGSLYFVYE